MTGDQYPICKNPQKLPPKARWIAAGIFVLIASGFGLLWASSNNYINLSHWFGVCGFKQRFHLPCPGCGWTHAAESFVTGHIFTAFTEQPAACVFCAVLAFSAIFALHCAIFGINSSILEKLFCSKNISIFLISACIIIVAGWVVTLTRTILENSGP